jgi:outer membrane immunogenic protein
LQIGYDWQFASSWVLGVVADIQASGMRDSASAVVSLNGFLNNVQANTASIDWFGTVRARLGVLVSPSLLVYGTAGLAYGEVKANTFQSNPNNGLGPVTFAGATSDTNFGWAGCIGIDYALTSNWRVGLEYLHIDLDSLSVTARQASRFNAVTLNTFTSTPDFNADIVRVTLNYKF